MLNQDISPGFDTRRLALKLSQAPVPQQIAEPDAGPAQETASTTRLVAEVLGNVLVGSALLAGLLAAPAVLGRLLGLA